MGTQQRMAAIAAAYAAGDDEDEDFIADESVKPKCDFLVTGDEELIKKYIETLKEQLAQGEGEAFVEVGTSVDGGDSGGLSMCELQIALAKNKEIAESLGCQVYPKNLVDRKNGNYSQIVFVRRNVDAKDFIEVC